MQGHKSVQHRVIRWESYLLYTWTGKKTNAMWYCDVGCCQEAWHARKIGGQVMTNPTPTYVDKRSTTNSVMFQYPVKKCESDVGHWLSHSNQWTGKNKNQKISHEEVQEDAWTKWKWNSATVCKQILLHSCVTPSNYYIVELLAMQEGRSGPHCKLLMHFCESHDTGALPIWRWFTFNRHCKDTSGSGSGHEITHFQSFQYWTTIGWT